MQNKKIGTVFPQGNDAVSKTDLCSSPHSDVYIFSDINVSRIVTEETRHPAVVSGTNSAAA
jgi:hypothetical protein